MSRANFVQVRLASAITAGDATIQIKAPEGGFVLPPADGGLLTLTDSTGRPTAFEIIRYTAREGLTLTGVYRGLEGTTPAAWNADTYALQSLTTGEFQAEMDAKANKSVRVKVGTGLEGGGDLSSDVNLSVKFGDTAGSAVEGNDSRLSNSREWTASIVSQAEAEQGTSTTARKWTAQRIWQAIAAWWGTITIDASKITSGTLTRNTTGNAATATKLATARTINGTSFDGSGNITTANWGTARTLTIGGSAKSVNGSANVSWSLEDIGAAAASALATKLGNSGNQSISGSLTVSGAVTGVLSHSSGYFTLNSYGSTYGQGACRIWYNANAKQVSFDGAALTNCSLAGNASTATKLATARTINGVAFDGTGNITITAAANGGTAAACSGNAATATKLATARTINGVAFDGSANITITAAANGGTSAACSGNAATATKLATARTINGVAFDGTRNITVADSTKLPLTGGTMTGVISHNAGAVENVTHQWRYNGTVRFAMGRTASGNAFHLWYYNSSGTYQGEFAFSAGNFSAPGNITAYSDIRLKAAIQVIPDALDKVELLRGVTYVRKDTGERQTGLIAQEVQAVLPEAVVQQDDGNKTLSVAYGNMVGLLVEAIKELRAELDALRQEVRA